MFKNQKIAIICLLFICFATTINAQEKKATNKNKVITETKPVFKKLNGVEYCIVKNISGKKPVIGDIVEANVLVIADTIVKATKKAEKFVVGDSRKENGGKPVPIKMDEKTFKGDFKEVLKLVSPGDSVVINVSVDTLMKSFPNQPMPPLMKKGRKITYEISVVSIKPLEEFQKEMQAKQAEMQKQEQANAAQQNAIDEKILQDYFAKNNLKPLKTEAGVYYVIHSEGAGATVAKGQTASINYTGRTLDGKMFDSNTDPSKGHVEPFKFPVGAGRVIKGWDDAVLIMKKGTKATIYIPSSLAYGSRGAGADIGPNQVLMFDMEVMGVE